MSRTVHPPYDTETMLRILRDDRELPRTTRVEFRGITMNGIKTVADLLSKFKLAGQFRLKVDKDADPRFCLVTVERPQQIKRLRALEKTLDNGEVQERRRQAHQGSQTTFQRP